MRELDVTTLQRADRIVVDQRSAALQEAGELMAAIADGAIRADAVAELGEIVAGTRPGREDADAITVFKSVGNAVQDAAVARAIWTRAVQMGLGGEWNPEG
jgi:ornithine cyclodeaminase